MRVLIDFLKDKRGDAVLLFLIFLVFLSLLFMQVVYYVTNGISAREYLVKVCDEIAYNISLNALDINSAEKGEVVIDITKANKYAEDTFKNLNIPTKNVIVEVKNNYVYVTIVVDGSYYKTTTDFVITGMAKVRDI